MGEVFKLKMKCNFCGRIYKDTPKYSRCICGTQLLFEKDKDVFVEIPTVDQNRKTNWSLLKEFWPILKECADIMTYADNGKHPRNSFLKETPEHQWECLQRHMYQDEFEDTINHEDGGYPHLAHAIVRLLMYYRIKQVRGKSLEDVR